MKNCFLILILFLSSSLVSAQQKGICVTVDDLPVVSYSNPEYAFKLMVTKKLLNTFKKYDIPAIGFVNEFKVMHDNQQDPQLVKLLDLWLSNGFELGNHTYSHKNYHQTSFAEFSEDILKGEVVTRALVKKHNQELKYFRHPYLRIGKTQPRVDSLKNFLTSHGYIEAPVTVDNEDYLFAKAYHIAYERGDKALMKRIGQAYVDYMEEKILFFEGQSSKLFNRNIQQILLIHASLLNADYMDELAKVCLKHGYSFISQTAALEDPAYQEKVTKHGDWGISWIDRWALSRGKRGEFFQGEPRTPAFILEIK